jgi:hypothetical protein
LNQDKVFIKIPESTEVENLQKLKEIFLENPGKQSVTLIFEKGVKRSVDLPIKINWNEDLARQISAVLEGRGLD